MATTTGRTSPAMSMKLLVDAKAGRVLFAEAGKDVVDFLFSLLALPVGTAVRLLGRRSVPGSASDLYASVQRLDAAAYLLPGADIGALLRPAVPSSIPLLCLPGPSSAKGFVQGVVTYTVTDNLTVTTMSAISSITLLNTFLVRDLSALQEKILRIGYKEGLAILKASLQSKTVLTDVFLAHKAPRPAV
ncbi:hypothetical protein VPH35_046674 [Triticum aestivum]